MGRRYAKRLLAGLMCAILVFQSDSVSALAAEQVFQSETAEGSETDTSDQSDEEEILSKTVEVETSANDSISSDSEERAEESEVAIKESTPESETEKDMKDGESVSEKDSSDKSSSESSSPEESSSESSSPEESSSGNNPSEEGSLGNSSSEEGSSGSSSQDESSPEDSSLDESMSSEQNTSIVESSSEELSTEEGVSSDEGFSDEMTSTQETETNTEEKTGTEMETETKTESETVIPGEFRDVSIEFDGYHAIVDAVYTWSSEAESAMLYFVQYDEDGNEIETHIDTIRKDNDETEYSINYTENYLYNDTKKVKLKAVESDANGIELTEVVYSGEFIRENIPEILFTAGEAEIDLTGAKIPLTFEGNMYRPEGENSSTFSIGVQLQYGIEDTDEQSTGMYVWGIRGNTGEELTVYINDLAGLKENTTYHAKLFIKIEGCDYTKGNIYEQTIELPNFTTMTDQSYDLEKEFPDEVFRSIIKMWLGLADSEMTVKASQLGRITSLYNDRQSFETDAIKDIKGIELLYNLENVTIKGHEITDISNIDWGKLSKLNYLCLESNFIETLPDLTQNAELKTFWIQYNCIPVADVQNARSKVPEGCTVGAYGQRTKEFKLTLENKYYQINDKSEIAVKVEGYNHELPYVFKCYIDDNPIEMTGPQGVLYTDNEGYCYSIMYNRELPYGTGTHKFKLEMYEGEAAEKAIISEEREFEIVEESAFLVDRNSSGIIDAYYMSAQDEYLPIHTYSTKEIKEAYIVKEKTIYGKNEFLKSNSEVQYIQKYPNISGYNSSNTFYSTYADIYLIKNEMPAGIYDLKLVYADGAEEIIEGAVNVITTAIIKGYSIGYGYDNGGDYLYIALTADYLDPSQVNYTVKDGNTNKVLQTEYVDSKPIYNGYVVKLKKIGWDNDVTTVRVQFSAKENYQLFVDIPVNSFCYTIEELAYFYNYNFLTEMFEVGISSKYDIEGYECSIVRSDSWDFSTEHIQETYTVRLDKVEDTIYNAIPQWEGKDCKLYGGYYRFTISRKDIFYNRSYDFNIPGKVIPRVMKLEDNGYWGDADYNLVQKGTTNRYFYYYSEIPYVNGNQEDFSAQIVGDSLEAPIDPQYLGTYNHSSGEYKTAINMNFDFSMLEVGTYTIEVYYLDQLFAEYEIEVIPDGIFVLYNNLYMNWDSDESFYLNFYTPNIKDDDEFTFTLTDINGNEVEGLSAANIYKYNTYVNVYFSGLKKSEADKYYYIKIQHKTKGDAYCKDMTTKYFSGFGKYTRINVNSKYGWNYVHSNGNMIGHSGVWINDKTIFPANLGVYKFNDTESIYNIVLTEEDFEYNNYYFTQDLIDMLPRAEGYYDIVLSGNKGQFLIASAAHIVLKDYNEFRVTPASMTLKLDVEAEASRTITALNCTETPVFESADTTIATVTVSDEDPTVATVSAVGLGTTSITVTSGRFVKQVTVVVTETPVEATGIQFNNSEVTAIQGTTIAANVTVEPEKAWTSNSRISYVSSDENIVAVGDSATRNISLTAKNPGTAVITAKLEGTGLTAECKVTVVAGFTEEDQAKLVSEVGDLYFLQGAEETLADISLPAGWKWSNPSQKPTADGSKPVKEFNAIYTKDGLDYFSAPLPVSVTSVKAEISGASEMGLSDTENYKMEYKYTGFEPAADQSVYQASIQWSVSENLQIQGDSNAETVNVTSVTSGKAELKGILTIKNTQSGKELKNTLNYTINIKDDTDKKNEEIKNKMFYFLAGADAKLGDITIGNGWSWVNPDTILQADDSIAVQNFAAKYAADGKQTINARLSVAVAALEKVSISGASKVAAGGTASYKLAYTFSGYDISDTEGYDISYHWKGNEGLTIDGADNTDTVSIQTGNMLGSYTLTAEVTVTNKKTGNSVKAEEDYTVQVLEKGSIDSIAIRPAEKQPTQALACTYADNALEADYTAFNKNNSYRIQLTAIAMAGGEVKNTAVSWESSDTKVASITSEGLITVKKAGIAVITATALDNGGYSEEIQLKIQDFTPTLGMQSATVYQYSSIGTDIGITAQNGNRIKSVTVSAPKLTMAADAGVWYLKADGYTKKTVENTVLKISTDKGEYEKPLKVTINVTQPKATVKQEVKPNIFYADAKAVYKVKSSYAIERIEDASGTSEACFHVSSYDPKGGLLTLEPYGITENIESYKSKNSDALKAKVRIIYEGYATPVEMTIKVNVQNKKPSLKINTASLIKNSGMDEALTTVLNGKTVYDLSSAEVNALTESVDVSVLDGKLRLNYDGTSNVTYRVNIQDRNWTQAVTLKGKLQMVNADALAMQAEKTKVTVNKACLSTVAIPVAIKGNSALEPNINLNYNESALDVVYNNGAVEITALEDTPDGTYKIEVGGSLDIAGQTVNIKKAVIKITVTSKAASVKLFASGKINIADREYSATTYTPTLKNMDAELIETEVVETNEDSLYLESFYTYVDENGKVVLKAMPGKPLSAGKTYEISIASRFDNGYEAITKVKIKPVNKLPKVKASLTKGTLYKAGVDSSLRIKLTLDSKYTVSSIKQVEDAFSKYFTVERDSSGMVLIKLSEEGMKLQSGTYTVSYQVLIADADNTKPIKQNVKVTVN